MEAVVVGTDSLSSVYLTLDWKLNSRRGGVDTCETFMIILRNLLYPRNKLRFL